MNKTLAGLLVATIGLFGYYLFVTLHFMPDGPIWLLALVIAANALKCVIVAAIVTIAFPPKWKWFRDRFPWIFE